MDDTRTGAPGTVDLDAALVAAFELADERDTFDAVASAAAAFGVDVEALWDHLAAGIDLWPLAAGLTAAPVHHVRAWARRSDDPVIAAAAAANPKVGPAVLDEVVEVWSAAGNPLPLRGVARNPAARQATLVRLATYDDDLVVEHAARNVALPGAVLAQLATSDNTEVCAAVAGNPSTPPSALALLARTQSTWVRYHVARNPATPTEVLEVLADGRANYASTAADEALIARRSTTP